MAAWDKERAARRAQALCRVLVLGGYGHFGGRICRALAQEAHIELIIAGRHLAAAQALAGQLHVAGPAPEAVALDHASADLADRLRALGAGLVVHTGGPYQGQDYHVARASHFSCGWRIAAASCA